MKKYRIVEETVITIFSDGVQDEGLTKYLVEARGLFGFWYRFNTVFYTEERAKDFIYNVLKRNEVKRKTLKRIIYEI